MKTLIVLGAVAFAMMFRTDTAQAELRTQTVYKVQVQYWFWDSNYTYWSDYYETTNSNNATWMYLALLIARENGNLNNVAPNVNWKYIAIDVRLKETQRPIWVPTDSLLPGPIFP